MKEILFCCHFFSVFFYFLSSLLSDTNRNKLHELGHKYILGPHFNPRLTARAKMSLSRAQNIFMPANMDIVV